MKKLQMNHGHSPTNRAGSTNNIIGGRKDSSSNTGPGNTGGNMFAG